MHEEGKLKKWCIQASKHKQTQLCAVALWGDSDAFILLISQIFISLPPGTHERCPQKKIEREQGGMSSATSGDKFQTKDTLIKDSLFNWGQKSCPQSGKSSFFGSAVKVKVRVKFR